MPRSPVRLVVLLTLLLISLPVGWWTIGYVVDGDPEVRGFSDQPISFEFEDMPITVVLAKYFPGDSIRMEASEDKLITLKADDMEAYIFMAFVASLADYDVVRDHGVITVREKAWLKRHYQGVSLWCQERLGFTPWGRR